jgi:hypothetical protein
MLGLDAEEEEEVEGEPSPFVVSVVSSLFGTLLVFAVVLLLLLGSCCG